MSRRVLTSLDGGSGRTGKRAFEGDWSVNRGTSNVWACAWCSQAGARVALTPSDLLPSKLTRMPQVDLDLGNIYMASFDERSVENMGVRPFAL